MTVLDVHYDDRVGHDGIGSGVERQHGADLAGTAAERLRVEVTEVGLQGRFDLAEDGGGYDGLLQVGVERAEQQITRQDRHEHVGVEHRHRPRHGSSGSGVEAERFGVADHVLEGLATLGDHLVPVGQQVGKGDAPVGTDLAGGQRTLVDQADHGRP